MLPPDPLLSYPSCFIASHLVMLHHVASYHIASPPPPSPPPPSPVQSPRLHYPIHLVSAHLTWLCYIMSSYHIPSHLSTAKHMCTCTVGRAKVRTQTSHCAFEHTHTLTHTYTHRHTLTHTHTDTHTDTHVVFVSGATASGDMPRLKHPMALLKLPATALDNVTTCN